MENLSFLIRLRDVDIVQVDGEVVLQQVSFDVAQGEFVYLIGKTGSGKSSLLKTLYCDLPLRKGQAIVAGYNLQKITSAQIPHLRRKLGIIFQDFQLLTDRNIQENFLFVMKATGWKSLSKMNERIDFLLEMVGLEKVHHRFPHQLSGGEQQRICIARALINNPDIVLADEPTGNLDPTVANEILQLFVRIHQHGTAVLMATHQHAFLRSYPARVVFCENKQIKDIDKRQVLHYFHE